MLARLTGWTTRRPVATLAVWLLGIGVLAGIGHGLEDRLVLAGVHLENTEAAREAQLREETFGRAATVPVLLRSEDPAKLERATRLLARDLRADPANRVMSPYARDASAALRPRDGLALVLVTRRLERGEQPRDALPPVQEQAAEVGGGVSARAAGGVSISARLNDLSLDAAAKAEMLAMPILILVLLLLFRSPLAALVPGVVGGATVAASMGIVSLLLSAGLRLDAFGAVLCSLMGLALGVDYSLLMVTRFRAALAERGDPAQAAAATTLSAGRTVAHAAVVLAVAMVTALIFAPGQSTVSASIGVLATTVLGGLSALVAVPAALTLIGPRIDRFRIGGTVSRPPRSAGVADAVLRRPVTAALCCLIPLGLLGTLSIGLDAGPPTGDQLALSDPVRQDVETLRETFGVGWQAPMEITVASEDGPVTAPPVLRRLGELQQRLSELPDVASVVGPREVVAGLGGSDRVGTAIEAGRGALTSFDDDLARAGTALRAVDRSLGRAVDAGTRTAAGSRSLTAGAGALRDGAARALDGADRLTDGLGEAERRLGALAAAADRLVGGATSLRGAGDEALAGARELERATGRLRAGSTALASALDGGGDRLRALREPVGTATGQLDAALGALRSASVGKVDPKVSEAATAVGTASAALTGRDPRTGASVRDGYDGLDAALASAASRVDEGADAARRVRDGAVALDRGTTALRRGLQDLRDGQATLLAGLRQAARGADGGVAGLGALREGSATARDGLRALDAGADRLRDGLTSVGSASGRLRDGIAQGRADGAPLRGRLDAAGRMLGRLGDETSLDDSPGLTASGYLALAAIDGASGPRRSASGLLVDLRHGGRGMRMFVIPTVGVGTAASERVHSDVVALLRELEADTDLRAAVGGVGGELVEYRQVVARRFPILVVALALVSALILAVLLRALLVPLVAVALNLVTVTATFGVLAVLFTGEHAVFSSPGSIDMLAMTMIFVIVFALSIDYQVFLLSRMHEEVRRGGSARAAVRAALTDTGPVVTGAALIMCAVFGAFATSGSVFLQQLGIGLVLAIAIDATIVRMVLLPAILAKLGDRAWTPTGRRPRATSDASRGPVSAPA